MRDAGPRVPGSNGNGPAVRVPDDNPQPFAVVAPGCHTIVLVQTLFDGVDLVGVRS
jgi:hypothetical protein